MPRRHVIRQGDVYLTKVSELPKGLEPSKNKVVQYGEVTGHHHQFAPTAQCQIFEAPQSDARYISVEEASVLEHDEHDNVEIPKGEYEIGIQRELDIVQQERRVVD